MMNDMTFREKLKIIKSGTKEEILSVVAESPEIIISHVEHPALFLYPTALHAAIFGDANSHYHLSDNADWRANLILNLIEKFSPAPEKIDELFNIRNHTKSTLLMDAVRYGQFETVSRILTTPKFAKHVDLWMRDEAGRNIFDMAQQYLDDRLYDSRPHPENGIQRNISCLIEKMSLRTKEFRPLEKTIRATQENYINMPMVSRNADQHGNKLVNSGIVVFRDSETNRPVFVEKERIKTAPEVNLTRKHYGGDTISVELTLSKNGNVYCKSLEHVNTIAD